MPLTKRQIELAQRSHWNRKLHPKRLRNCVHAKRHLLDVMQLVIAERREDATCNKAHVMASLRILFAFFWISDVEQLRVAEAN